MSIPDVVLSIWESALRDKQISFEEAYRQIADLKLDQEDYDQLLSFIKKTERRLAREARAEERKNKLNENFKQTKLEREKKK